MLKLASRTDPGWAERALGRLDEILLDHAHCERKAAGMAVTLLFRYPERASWQRPLSELAREELSHFESLLGVLARRNLAFARQRPSSYAGRLRRAVRADEPGRGVDLLLCSALIEARSCERLGLLAAALEPAEPELAALYDALQRAEARHHGLYVELACELEPRERVRQRLAELASAEARALAAAEPAGRLHGGGAAA